MSDEARQAQASGTKDAAIDVWRTFATGDPVLIRAVLADDVVWTAPPANATAVALGVTHHMVGPDAITSFIVDDVRRLFVNGIDIEPISVTAEADRVVFEQRQRATLVNGRSYDLTYVFVVEMAGHRVRRIREYMDTRSGYQMVFGDESPGRIA